VSAYANNLVCNIFSSDGSIPGTNLEGEKAIYSFSKYCDLTF